MLEVSEWGQDGEKQEEGEEASFDRSVNEFSFQRDPHAHYHLALPQPPGFCI